MQGKKVSESRFVMSAMMEPSDTNPYGSVHGGVIMKSIDVAGAVAAIRHCRMNAVTASVDSMSFIEPVHVGELVFYKANVNLVGSSSLEVGVRVESEDLYTGDVRYVASAYLTYVAVDEHGKPSHVPPLILETEEDERRHREATARREERLRRRMAEKASQEG